MTNIYILLTPILNELDPIFLTSFSRGVKRIYIYIFVKIFEHDDIHIKQSQRRGDNMTNFSPSLSWHDNLINIWSDPLLSFWYFKAELNEVYVNVLLPLETINILPNVRQFSGYQRGGQQVTPKPINGNFNIQNVAGLVLYMYGKSSSFLSIQNPCVYCIEVFHTLIIP